MKLDAYTTTLGEFILRLKSRSLEIIRYIYNLDFSSLEKEIFGISLLEVMAAAVAIMTIFQVIKWIINSTLEILTMGFRALFNYLFSLLVLLSRAAWLRIKHTAIHLWSLARNR